MEDTSRFTRAITIEERILFRISECLAELGDDIVLQVEGIIIEQFLSHLDGNVELIGIQVDLVEGRIAKGQCATLFDPRGRRFGRSDINLVLTGSGDSGSKTTHDVLFSKNVDKSAVIFLRNKVTALLVDTFLQNVINLLEVGAKSLQHCVLILVGGTTGFLFLFSRERFTRNGRVHRHRQHLVHFSFTSFTLDFVGESLDVSFHLFISSIVFRRKTAILIFMGSSKFFGIFPKVSSLVHQFENSHFNSSIRYSF